MAENLRTTKYNDGSLIPLVIDNTTWLSLSTGGYCNYNNTINTDTIVTFGRLYNWNSVNSGKLAPKGWHVPTNEDWITLVSGLGGELIAGDKLKEKGNIHWGNPNYNSTNESGFTALPGGCRNTDGSYSLIGLYGYWWSSTTIDNTLAFGRGLGSYNSNLGVGMNFKNLGFSIRCVKD